MSDAISVKRFIINNDVEKSQRLLLKKCKGYLHRYFLRAMAVSMVLIVAGIIMSGFSVVHEDAIVFTMFCVIIILLCTMYLTDIRMSTIPLSIVKSIQLYIKLSDNTFDSVGDLFEIDEAEDILRGKQIISVLQGHSIHHVSLTHDGNLALIATDVNGVDSLASYKVDMNQIADDTNSVDIVVDACYIKAQPCYKN